jgi:glycosyltransferase involved in cell wall biosynthesis
MFEGKTLSLIFPAKDEEENIKNAINSFKALKIFDELLVVDNNSTDKTADISVKNGAKVIKEKNPGYGFALRKGLKIANGEYIVLCEPDGTFSAKDSLRLLKQMQNYDMVAGSRTNPKFIKKDSNMGFSLRLGNIMVAKLIQFLFFLPPLSDCGCTFRVIKKEKVKKMNPKFTVGKSHFLPELVILNKINGGTMIEVPVHYSKRIGKSKITGSKIKSIQVGFRMLLLIFSYRLKLIKSN